ncbi:MAG: metal ABC transporter ATP-binding protein [Acidimicrobiia bacterium]
MTSVRCRLGSTVAVDDVHLAVAPGQHMAITGPNGAGKSTLLRTVLGLTRASGQISLDGAIAVDRHGWEARRRLVAWVPQRPATGRFPLRVRELLASSGDLDAAVDAAERLGIGNLANRPLHTLSGGQLQRSYLARGLGHIAAGAQLFLADEPTSALDFETRDHVAHLLTQIPITTLIVTHDATIAAAADRVAEMAAGRVRETAS